MLFAIAYVDIYMFKLFKNGGPARIYAKVIYAARL